MEPFREISPHPSADIHVHVSTGAGLGAGAGRAPGPSLDWSVANYRAHVLRAVLDASGLAASGMGAVRGIAGSAAAGHFELLDERILERLGGRSGWRAGAGRPAANAETREGPRCSFS